MLKKTLIIYIVLIGMCGLDSSCHSENSACEKDGLLLTCEIRNWEVKIIAPNLDAFSKVDSVSYFWPIDPEAQNMVFKSRDGNTYIIFQYCEYHYDGDTPLSVYSDAFTLKMIDAAARKVNTKINNNYFITDCIIYSEAFGQDIYLVAKVFKLKNDIVKVFGINCDSNIAISDKDLYSIIKTITFLP